MDKSKIYIDLTMCTEEERKHVFSLLPDPILSDDYDIRGKYKYLLITDDYDNYCNKWYVGYSFDDKTELTYPEFIKLLEGGEGENNGWIKIESESIIPNGDYWMIENEENEIMAVFDIDENTNQDAIRKYYSHYQILQKPELPKF